MWRVLFAVLSWLVVFGVAIQASRFKDHIDLRRYIVTGRHGICKTPCVVFSGADELDQHQDDSEGDEDFLDHGAKVRKRGNERRAEGQKGRRAERRKGLKWRKGLKRHRTTATNRRGPDGRSGAFRHSRCRRTCHDE